MNKKSLSRIIISGVLTAAMFAAVLSGCSPDEETAEESPIQSVTAIGFVDLDGAKVEAVALEYAQDMAGADISADTYSLKLYNSNNNYFFSDGSVGEITKIYVNNTAEMDENGGSGSGRYVILEVFTDYISATESSYTASMVARVTQVKDIILPDGEVISSSTAEANNLISTTTVNEITGKTTTNSYLDPEGYIISDIEGFKFYTDNPGTVGADGPAFYQENCFDQRDGLYYDISLSYALWLPEDWHAGGNYAMVTIQNPAASEGTHPLTSVLETRSPAYYASDAAQELVKEEHGVDGMIVVVPVVTQRVNDNGGTPAEYEALVHLWDYLIETYSVNENYVYGSGQSVGGMVLLETQRNRDNFFAGLLLYEDQWAQNYYVDTLFVRNMASNESTAATAQFHYPRTDSYITWDYHWGNDGEKVGVDEGHDPYNYYYLASDDNILVLRAADNGLCVDTWNEMSYLYQDLTGDESNGIQQLTVEIGEITRENLDEQNEQIAEFLNSSRIGLRNINAISFVNGSNGYTGRLYDAAYEWLLTQSRETEMTRDKLDLNKPFVPAAEEDQIQTEERMLHFTDADGNALYFITGLKGAGTQFYNTSWLNLLTVADAAPGWLPDGMEWEYGVGGVSGSSIVSAQVIENGAAIAVEYTEDMENLYINLLGDPIMGYNSDVPREDIAITVPPFSFYDNDGNIIECSIINVYVNDSPQLVNGLQKGEGSGKYLIIVFEEPLTVSPSYLIQRTTLHTDKYIASALPWKYYIA